MSLVLRHIHGRLRLDHVQRRLRKDTPRASATQTGSSRYYTAAFVRAILVPRIFFANERRRRRDSRPAFSEREVVGDVSRPWLRSLWRDERICFTTRHRCRRGASRSQAAAAHQTIRHETTNDTAATVDCVAISVLTSVKIMTLAKNESMLYANDQQRIESTSMNDGYDSRPHQ